MGRIRFHATHDEEAQYSTTHRRGTARVAVYGFAGDPAQTAWAEALAKGITDTYRNSAVFLATGGDLTETGRRWAFLIGLGDESEEDVEADGFWPVADDWLEGGNPNDWRRLEEEFLEEWEGRIEALNGTDDAYGDYTVEVDGLRVWDR